MVLEFIGNTYKALNDACTYPTKNVMKESCQRFHPKYSTKCFILLLTAYDTEEQDGIALT